VLTRQNLFVAGGADRLSKYVARNMMHVKHYSDPVRNLVRRSAVLAVVVRLFCSPRQILRKKGKVKHYAMKAYGGVDI
jgi:hypothetical protein